MSFPNSRSVHIPIFRLLAMLCYPFEYYHSSGAFAWWKLTILLHARLHYASLFFVRTVTQVMQVYLIFSTKVCYFLKSAYKCFLLLVTIYFLFFFFCIHQLNPMHTVDLRHINRKLWRDWGWRYHLKTWWSCPLFWSTGITFVYKSLSMSMCKFEVNASALDEVNSHKILYPFHNLWIHDCSIN